MTILVEPPKDAPKAALDRYGAGVVLLFLAITPVVILHERLWRPRKTVMRAVASGELL